jgi:hypothetical protein
LIEHDLFGKPVSTFPDHALAQSCNPRTGNGPPIGPPHQLFFGFRISLRIGVFSDDTADHEFESTAKMTWVWFHLAD